MAIKKQTSRTPVIGVFWMIGWALCINGAMMGAKQLTPGISSIMLIFMRSLFGFLVLIPFFYTQGREIWKSQQKFRQGIAVVLGTFAMGCTYYAYRNLPLSFATAVGFTGPLLTTLFSTWFLKDRVTWAQWGAIAIGYGGVLLLLHPRHGTFNEAVLALLCANVCASLLIINRKVMLRTDSPATCLAYAAGGGAFLAALLAPFFWEPLVQKDVGILFIVGIFGVCSHFCYLNALKVENASYVSPFEYTRLLIAVPLGVFFFGEQITPIIALGAFLIIGGGILLLRLKIKS